MECMRRYKLSRPRTQNVEEAACRKCWWSWQELAVHARPGTHTSALPVSKQAVKACGGVPTEKLPKYCGARCMHGAACGML